MTQQVKVGGPQWWGHSPKPLGAPSTICQNRKNGKLAERLRVLPRLNSRNLALLFQLYRLIQVVADLTFAGFEVDFAAQLRQFCDRGTVVLTTLMITVLRDFVTRAVANCDGYADCT